MAATTLETHKIEVDHKEDASDHAQLSSRHSDDVDSQAWGSFDEDDLGDPAGEGPRGEEEDDDEGWIRNPNNPREMSRWIGQPSVKGNSDAMRMILLNFCTLGITFTWGIEMTYCTPYLLSLGLTKSKTSLVWIAGPLSGLLVQPIVGAIADESKSKWGRRKPFIVLGAVIVAVSLLILGFTKEIVGLFVSEPEAAKTLTIFVAVISIYAVDFSINAVMSAARSLMVDVLPISKQQDGAAWNGRMSAVGHMIGYSSGAIDLGSFLGNFLGETQFKKLTVIAAIGILVSSLITSWAVKERILVDVRHDPREARGRFKVVRQIWSTIIHLPPRIRAICHAQFWAWIGWFPFLFYSTTWIGETYFRYDIPDEAKSSKDALGDMGRIGSASLVIYSVITFLGAWLLPFVVKSPEDESFTRRPPQGIAPLVEKFHKYKPDLLTTWMIAHAMFACAMYLAPFASSYKFATVLVCICGLPWTIAMWAPVTFLGIEVNKLSGGGDTNASYQRLSNEMVEMSNMNGNSDTALDVEHGPNDTDTTTKNDSAGELSGIYFGILNIYTTIPQFIGTFISTIVFGILEPGKSPELANDAHPDEHHSTDGPNAIAVCLFIGAISATMAIFATRKLKYL